MTLYVSKESKNRFALDMSDLVPLFGSSEVALNKITSLMTYSDFVSEGFCFNDKIELEPIDVEILNDNYRRLLSTATIVRVEYFNQDGRRYILDEELLEHKRTSSLFDEFYRYYIIVKIKGYDAKKSLFLHVFTTEFNNMYDRVYANKVILSNIDNMSVISSINPNFEKEVYKKGNVAGFLEFTNLFPSMWRVIKDAFRHCPFEIAVQLLSEDTMHNMANKYDIENLKENLKREEKYDDGFNEK